MCKNAPHLKLVLLLPMLAFIFAKVQAGPVTSSDNTELLNKILQIVQEQGEQIKHLGEQFDVEKTSLLEISTKVEDLKTEENYLLSVLTGQQTQLATKIDKVEQKMRLNHEELRQNQEQIRTDIHAQDERLNKSTEKLACKIAQHDLSTTTLSGKQYYFSFDQTQLNWSEAQTFCRSHHMDLVSVETQDEWRALQPEVRKLKSEVGSDPWSSARDSAQEGKWVWNSGLDVTFYARKDIGNRDDQDCMYLHTDYWDDYPCSNAMSFICEVNSDC